MHAIEKVHEYTRVVNLWKSFVNGKQFLVAYLTSYKLIFCMFILTVSLQH
jgi:hypothetical protein